MIIVIKYIFTNKSKYFFQCNDLPGQDIPSTTVTSYNTNMNIKVENDPPECAIGSVAVIENTFGGREPVRNLSWKQARFIEFMSSHILQFSLPLQNEFMDGVTELYLEIAKRNH